jgi:hypothetical protein
MPLDDKQRERLEELRKSASQRQADEQDAADARELEAEELAAKLEAQGLVRGADFEVINNRLGGVYAVRRPDSRALRNWEAADEKKKGNSEWQIGLIRHYIVDPEGTDPKAQGSRGIVWAQTCAQRPGLLWQTTNAFIDLMSVDRDVATRK